LRREHARSTVLNFAWSRNQAPQQFTKALVPRYRTWLVDGQKLSLATVNLQLSPLRKLANEMVDNGLMDSMLARGIENVASSQSSPFLLDVCIADRS
jgi:hypothetical protein